MAAPQCVRTEICAQKKWREERAKAADKEQLRGMQLARGPIAVRRAESERAHKLEDEWHKSQCDGR